MCPEVPDSPRRLPGGADATVTRCVKNKYFMRIYAKLDVFGKFLTKNKGFVHLRLICVPPAVFMAESSASHKIQRRVILIANLMQPLHAVNVCISSCLRSLSSALLRRCCQCLMQTESIAIAEFRKLYLQ